MATFSGNDFYFDEDEYGISDGVFFDDIAYFDAASQALINGRPRFSFAKQEYQQKEYGTLIIRDRFIGIEDYSAFIDLMKLIPEKFRSSELLQQFIYEIGLDVGSWIGDISDLEQNLDPYNVAQRYLPYLAGLIGLEIISDEDTSDDEKRQQLLQAIDLYKIKGTYQSLIQAAYLGGLGVTMFDKYCSSTGGSDVNYNAGNFVDQLWWAGPLGTNPPGLDSSYFKTPHLGVSLPLTTVYGTYPNEYLFKPEMLVGTVSQYIERVRPVNVVIHYVALLKGQTNYTGTVIEQPGRVRTVLVDGWSFPGLNFDVPYNFDDTSPVPYFDQSPLAALTAMSRWHLGSGSKNIAPTNTGWDLETPIPSLVGDVTALRIYSGYAEFQINLPITTIQTGISEMVICLADDTTVKIGMTFPDIDLDGTSELNIIVTFYYA